MDKQLQLAVNHALAVNQSIAQQRLAYAKQNISGNTKRDRIYEEFGYPKNLTFDHFYNMYDRNSIAGAAIDRMNNGCWEDYPEIFEGSKAQDADGVTTWDKSVAKLFKKFLPIIKEADKRNLVGRYSAILIQVRDSRDWSQPVDVSVLKK